MRKPILYVVLLLSTNFLFAQGSITFNPLTPSVNNGIVDFTFDLVGGGAEYNLSVEVNFNDGTGWNDIDPLYITSPLENVVPATGIALQWDALSSFPGRVTSNAELKVIARHVCETSFTFTYRGSEVTYGTILIDYGGTIGERCWLDRNLGASRVANSSTDADAYGDLFQWGRGDDEHQLRNSGQTAGPTGDANPGSNFITMGSGNWYNGADPHPNNLWQEDGTGINNLCPSGWRIPTEAELDAERESWGTGNNNSAGAFHSDLKWPVGGRRYGHGALDVVGILGLVWSSSVSNDFARALSFSSGVANMGSYGRAGGKSVRCVRDN